MTKEEITKYENYIQDLIVNSRHTKADLIEDLVSRGVPEDIADQIVSKHVDT